MKTTKRTSKVTPAPFMVWLQESGRRGFWCSAESWDDASFQVRDFIERRAIGSSKWLGGEVCGEGCEIVGRISYNGRAWDRSGVALS